MPKTTQIDIIRAFEKVLLKKSYAKINVKDITDICGLNRKTFYYYFSDINDLLVKAFDFEINSFFENQPDGTEINSSLISFFDMVNNYREVVYHIYNSSGYDHLVAYIKDAVSSIINNGLSESYSNAGLTDEQKEIITLTFVNTITGFILEWLDGDMRKDVRTYVGLVGTLLRGVTDTMISNAVKLNTKQ